MAADADPKGLMEVLGWAVACVLAILSWLFARVMKKHDDEIREIKKAAAAALPRDEWQSSREDSMRERESIRKDLKELFGRDDNLKDYINTRAEAIETRMMAKLDSLRTDVNSGFGGLREELRHMVRPSRD